MEEIITRLRWKNWAIAIPVLYLLVVGAVNISFSLPVILPNIMPAAIRPFQMLYMPLREFNNSVNNPPIFLRGRIGWNDLVREIADVYNALPPEERAVAGIYADVYPSAGAIDQFGAQYGLPHAISGSLTYYLWGPGASWDVMVIVSQTPNVISVFFYECEQKAVSQREYVGAHFHISVCRQPKVPVDVLWSRAKSFH